MSAPAGTAVRHSPQDFDHPDEPRDLRGAGRTSALAGPPEKVWFGLLHGHTRFSDGSGTPKEAFAQAKQVGLDFFAVTEHNHAEAELGAGSRADGILIATTPDLYASTSQIDIGTSAHPILVDSLVSSAKAATTNTFAGLYGQEFSTISAGNHLNVLRWDEVLTIPKGQFKQLYDLIDQKVAAGAAIPVLQMNHPNVHSDLFASDPDPGSAFNDYGFDDYQKNFSKLVAASDRYISIIEVLSGPATTPDTHATYHFSHTGEADYLYYLSQGFHLSPSVGQDNHFKTWGKTTPARMGVYASTRSANDLYSAIRANRTFATEDTDLRIQFKINGRAMGDVITANEGTELKLSIAVSDPTDPSAEYTATVVHGFVEPQSKSSLREIEVRDSELDSYTLNEGTFDLDPQAAAGDPEFFYVRVTQESDGDRAWSAPIWINHPRNR